MPFISRVLDHDSLNLFHLVLETRKHKDKLHKMHPHIELADHLLSLSSYHRKAFYYIQGHLIHVSLTAVSLTLRKVPGIDKIKELWIN